MAEDRGIRVMVAVPTHDHIPAMFAFDLCQMVSFTAANYVGEGKPIDSIGLFFAAGTYVHTSRQDLAEKAVENGADCVLWLDSDMRFPKDLLIRLMRHNEDMVGINYSKRGLPPEFVAIKRISPPEALVTDEDSTGLEDVEACGFGAVLMKTKVLLETERPDKPWFWYEWDAEEGQQTGEDVYFCQQAREAGMDVYVDHDLSKECGHIGTFKYTTDHPIAMMEDALVEAG